MKHCTVIVLALCFSGLGCKKEGRVTDYPDNLFGYLESRSNLDLVNDLVACAGQVEDLTGQGPRLMCFLRTRPSASDFRYWETASTDVDPLDYMVYQSMERSPQNIFADDIVAFEADNPSTERWALVTYQVGNTVYVCNPIRYKGASRPTVWNNAVSIEGEAPSFCWEDETPWNENVIYFQAITETSDGSLVSGTYTYDLCYTFGVSDNVVFEVTPEGPAPELDTGETYGFTLMSVSIDNWVNRIAMATFTAP